MIENALNHIVDCYKSPLVGPYLNKAAPSPSGHWDNHGPLGNAVRAMAAGLAVSVVVGYGSALDSPHMNVVALVAACIVVVVGVALALLQPKGLFVVRNVAQKA